MARCEYIFRRGDADVVKGVTKYEKKGQRRVHFLSLYFVGFQGFCHRQLAAELCHGAASRGTVSGLSIIFRNFGRRNIS